MTTIWWRRSRGTPCTTRSPTRTRRRFPTLRPRRDARSTLRIGARAVAGTVGIGIAAAAIAAATWLPLPHYASTAPSMVVTPAATTQQRVCPGPALRPADAIDGNANASAIASVGHPEITAAAAKGTAGTAPLKATENGAGIAPTLLTLPASANAALAGSQSESVSAGGFAGFAAAECAETAAETWLVGGATDIGRFTLITLSNPGTVSATVSVTVFTEAGEVHAAGSDGIVVPGGSQRILPLAGFAPNVLSPVVRVRSAGGQVVANLQHGIVRTLAPGGLAIVGASAAPARQLAIPGVVLTGTAAIAAQQNSPGFADIAPVLRLYVPGTAEATVRIAVIPEDGSAPAEPSSLSVPGGVVTDVPIEAGDGSFTISLSADLPILAAARASASGSSGAIDLAWFAAAPVLHESAEVAVAAGPSPVLHLANPTRQTQTVTLATADAGSGRCGRVGVGAGGRQRHRARGIRRVPAERIRQPADCRELPGRRAARRVHGEPGGAQRAADPGVSVAARSAGTGPGPGPRGPCRAARRPRGTRSFR